ncbi:helix-turn-helix domain-containing protein [Streptomyces sp. NPDC003442]
MHHVRRFLHQRGGGRLTRQQRSPRQLTGGEREEISRGVAAGESARQLARRLGRSPSAVSREIARNGGRDRYRAASADATAYARGPGGRGELPARRQLATPPGEQRLDLRPRRRNPQCRILRAARPVHLVDRALDHPTGHPVDLDLVPQLQEQEADPYGPGQPGQPRRADLRPPLAVGGLVAGDGLARPRQPQPAR